MQHSPRDNVFLRQCELVVFLCMVNEITLVVDHVGDEFRVHLITDLDEETTDKHLNNLQTSAGHLRGYEHPLHLGDCR
jgi:hypothetical protein